MLFHNGRRTVVFTTHFATCCLTFLGAWYLQGRRKEFWDQKRGLCRWARTDPRKPSRSGDGPANGPCPAIPAGSRRRGPLAGGIRGNPVTLRPSPGRVAKKKEPY